MNDIRDINLEFLRSGPAHNQLLSPLTPYIALCGADGPVSVYLPFEHRQLLDRLARLRYQVDNIEISSSQRRSELHELGEAVSRVLGEIPALVGELRSARKDTSRLVNIQLKVSAFELALVPFELTMPLADTSGSAAPLLLSTLTSMTREIRRGEPLGVEWNRAPRILFAFASPEGFAAVPAQAHLEALRRAIDPWIKIKDRPEDRVVEVRNVLTVLRNATARSISDACQADNYTHVHILAHGAPIPGAEGNRFGVVLSKEGDPSGHAVIDGQSLAMALKSMNSNGRAKPPPTVVSLATCDSGNPGSVLAPGGSIAHELHAQDIPWVIASQFPLWMRASSIAVEVLYRGLLLGNDPRWVLHELRQRLRIDLPDTHDWASIVAYAAVSPDLEAQVDAFRTRQTKRSVEVRFDRMDELAGFNEPDQAKRLARDPSAVANELDGLCKAIRSDLAAWADVPSVQRNAKEQAERLGLKAASEKRIAIVYSIVKGNGNEQRSKEAYRKSREFYQAALQLEPINHWVMTQFLSIAAVPALAADDGALKTLGNSYGRWWLVARQLAQWQLRSAALSDRVWAHSTLAELEVLGVIYAGVEFDPVGARSNIAEHCRRIRELASPDGFPILSTQRQFRRYVDVWPRKGWDELIQVALKELDGYSC